MVTRADVFARQERYFGDKGLPKHFNENLFLPPLDGEDLRAFQDADGKELDAKMKSPHSSSALCVNFFRYWKRNGLQEFLAAFGSVVFGQAVTAPPDSSIRFEVKHRFGSTPDRRIVGGKPGNVDLDVRWGRSHAVLVESKFTEVFSDKPFREISEVNTGRYTNALGKYFVCDPAKFLSEGPEHRFYQLAQRMLYTAENEDPEFRAIPERKMLFLYYEYEDFQKDLLGFKMIVKPEYRDAVTILTYQDLFQRVRAALDESKHATWFDYMARRYF